MAKKTKCSWASQKIRGRRIHTVAGPKGHAKVQKLKGEWTHFLMVKRGSGWHWRRQGTWPSLATAKNAARFIVGC